MKILGIDPGVATVGFGLVESSGMHQRMISCGVITTPAHTPLSSRLDRIYSDLEELIRSCGLYHTKAQNIVDASRMLVEDYGGVMPSDMEELLKFPGVGRKIANLLRGDLFGLPAIVADTHCIRLCGRFGMYPESEKDPTRVEKTLVSLVEPAEQSDFCHRLVSFGREICTARNPKCGECPLQTLCQKGARAASGTGK